MIYWGDVIVFLRRFFEILIKVLFCKILGDWEVWGEEIRWLRKKKKKNCII